jgi:predicted transcriptional regulator of viral defense system
LSDINVIVENGIISMTSAAFYYKLLDGEEGRITVTLDRDQKPPKMPYEIFNYFYTTTELHKLGLKIIDQNGRQIKIYDRERTIVDIIKHRSKFDDDVIFEILENYLSLADKDIEKLYDYAEQMRIFKILMDYINQLGGRKWQIQKK